MITKYIFKIRFENKISQIVKDSKELQKGPFMISLNKIEKLKKRKNKNINWVYSKRNEIKKYYPNEFIMKMVRGLGFEDSFEWYNN